MADRVDSADGNGSDDDALLTAWLDGQLSAEARAALDRRMAAEPGLRARLDVLRAGERDFEAAYAALLAAAPAERLKAMLAAKRSDRRSNRASGPASRRWLAVAAALVLFAGGGIAGYVASVALTPEPESPGWRQVVADYHALISPETILVISEDPEALSAELLAIGDRMALDLAPERLALPHAYLKRAQLYDYAGMALVQLVYLSPESGPFALCIIANGRSDTERGFEQRVGSNIVYWYKDGFGYMLIGKDAPRETLEAFADEIAARFG
jgi:anti-sigma factor RsiW